jgi:hypothetical protein
MHLVETYALNCGLKIGEPFIYEKYCPIPFDNYISFQPCSKYESKSYDLWQEVINQIQPKLAEKNIHIVQIGGKDEKAIDNCYHLQGKTTINQAAYIIKRGMLHFGADSFGIHIASSYDKPIVALYSNSRPENAGPYFNKSNNVKLIEINKSNRKPSYAAQESPKTINEIDPIEVANAILEFLNIDKVNIKTVYIGGDYFRKLIESAPDSVIDDISKLGVNSLIMRADYELNEKALEEQLKRNNCSISTNKPINKDLLTRYKNNIAQIIYDLDENHDIEFAKFLRQLARPFVLSTYLSEEFIQSIKLEYMEYGQVMKLNKSTKDDIPAIKDKDLNNLYYKSNKITISKGKVYNSKAAYKLDMPFEGKPLKVIDTPEFWEESKYFYIFELTKD